MKDMLTLSFLKRYDGVQFFEFIEEKQEELQQECIMI